MRNSISKLVSVIAIVATHCPCCFGQGEGFDSVIRKVQPNMVKIKGSGGFSGLEAYQSGFLISSEGHILTVWSYVLDTETVRVTLNDGQAFDAKLVGYDPKTEIAVLKIDAKGLSSFNLDGAVDAKQGAKVLAFSNLYNVATGNEPTSVLQGIVSAIVPLNARRGSYETPFKGNVYIVDAMTNNPGAPGGAVTDRRGRIIGLIGKELRDGQTNSWLNFAIPIPAIAESVADIRSGKMVVQRGKTNDLPAEPITLELLGLALVPNVVTKTPPFVDQVSADSASLRAGIELDDLVVEINGKMTPSINVLLELLETIDRDETISITVQRKKEFKTFKIKLSD